MWVIKRERTVEGGHTITDWYGGVFYGGDAWTPLVPRKEFTDPAEARQVKLRLEREDPTWQLSIEEV